MSGPLSLLLVRCAAYPAALLAVMRASEVWFGDTYAANVSLFAIFCVSFELLLTAPRRLSRAVWVWVCVVGMAASGVFLTHETLGVRAVCQQEGCR